MLEYLGYIYMLQNRTVGNAGVPGIFMKYDIASFKVHVRETHEPVIGFLIRLIGIVGGVFATSGTYNRQIQVTSVRPSVCLWDEQYNGHRQTTSQAYNGS